jgi:L-threonylcarbamoyladenylate synthase
LGEDLLILDGGPCSLGIESTIVDCTRGVPVLLRPGSISSDALAQACGQALVSAADLALAAAPRASGTLDSHYAPRARVRLLDAAALQAALPQPTVPIGVYVRSFEPVAASGQTVRRMPATAAQTAHELFAVLRALDDAGVQEIWVERVPATPEWAGVADRLMRASA